MKAVAKVLRIVLLGGLLVAVVGAALYAMKTKGSAGRTAEPASASHAAAKAVDVPKVHRVGSDGLLVPGDIAREMGLQVSTASVAQHAIRLPSFQGVLNLDNDRLSRIHSRFRGEVVALGQSTDGSDPTIHVGEHIQAGDLLAVVWSTELGAKKSELVDALAKLRSEEELRDRLKKLFDEGAGAGRPYRDAEKDVRSRHVEIASLERTLRTWRVTDEEIAEVHAEAERLASPEAAPRDSKDWARVEIRAPMSGTILEKNVTVGYIVDTDSDLFKIGDLSHMVIWAHVYEDDLPLLESLKPPVDWTVTLPSRPEASFEGKLEKIGPVIDPAQHTALITGHVQNDTGDLKIGQFVTVTITLPPPENELELPSSAVIEDARESVVFVQPDAADQRFVRRRVKVCRRFRDNVYVRIAADGVAPGDRIVTAGALMLQNAMIQLPVPAGESPDSVARHTPLRNDRP